MSVVYAIDLGTTYSKCAFLHPETNQVVVVPLGAPDSTPFTTEEIERAAPLRSVVALGADSRGRFAIVGAAARAAIGKPGLRVIEEAKALIGESLSAPLDDEPDPPPWHVDTHEWSYLPQDIGALVLRRIKQIVDRRYPQWPMQRVVITHPQRFEDPRREATRQAGRFAGLDVVATITEPDAAAVCFGLEAKPGRYLIFDVGGGTLDVTVAALEQGKMRVLSAGGVHVGGRHYDNAIFTAMFEQYAANFPHFSENSLDPETRAAWMRTAEEIKTQLCEAVTRGDTQPFARREIICSGPLYEGGPLRFTLSADALAARTKPLDEECRRICDGALEQASLGWDALDGVVMVGGSSLNPWLQAMLTRAYTIAKPYTELGASTAIARGAAIFAAHTTPQPPLTPRPPKARRAHAALAVDDLEVNSVLRSGLGIKVWDPRREADIVFSLVKKGQSIPHRYERTFRTVEDDDEVIPIELYEGDDDDPALCTLIGECMLAGIPSGRPAGERVLVAIEIDHAARKTIVARHVSSGKEAISTIRYDEDRVVPEDDEDRRRKHLASIEVRG